MGYQKFLKAGVFVAAMAVATTAFGDDKKKDDLPQVAKAGAQAAKSEATAGGLMSKVGKYVGVNYDFFFNGPGVGYDADRAPNNTGRPTGLNSFNLVSVRAKLTERIGIDVQLRSLLIYARQPGFLWQGQRFGVSGLLAKGETWSLRGVINTDLPIPGLAGQVNEQRTLILNPGTFAFFSWAPKFTKANLFMGLFPRAFFYRDGLAMASPQDGGLNPGQKLQLSLPVYASVNYPINDWIDARAGAWIQFQKQVVGSFQRDIWPLELGVNFKLSKYLSIYPFVRGTGPWDDGARAALYNDNSHWAHTIASGVWLRGTLL